MYSNATSAGGEAQMIWALRGGSRTAVLSLSFLFVNYDDDYFVHGDDYYYVNDDDDDD